MTLHTLDATALRQKLEDKEVSSVEIVRALLDRADHVDGKIRSLVHRFDEAALERAKAADDARAKGESWGPFHGLPVTIKESVATKGQDVTLGVPARKNKPAAEDAVVVKLLRDAGAIVIGKTNVSQLLLFNEADNPIWGATNNPWNLDRVPGGSSGGEAAAIAGGISPWGVGTDIGGSIRVPCAYCGIAGLKPTVDRWSNIGCSTALMGQEVIRGQNGPMARTVRDVTLMFRTLDSPLHATLDPGVSPIPTQDPAEIDLKGLKIGFFTDDGYLEAASSLARGVEWAAKALEARGATVVPFHAPRQNELMDLYFAALSSDGGATIDAQLDGEPVVDQLKQLRRIAKMPATVRKAASVAMGVASEPRVKRLLRAVGQKPVDMLWRLTSQRSGLRKAVFDAWNKHGLDAVLSPPHVTPAVRHGDTADFSVGGSYAMRYNLLNFPAGIVPVSRVQPNEVSRPRAYDRMEKKARDIEAKSAGLPVGVQVAGRPFGEATVLAVMAALEAAAVEEETFPRTPVDP